MATNNLTGYGLSTRFMFDGDERKYALWETKFYAHLHTLKVKKGLENMLQMQERMQTLNAELIQLLDDRRLSPIMHDAKDDGKKALQILKEHALYESRKTEGDCLVRWT